MDTHVWQAHTEIAVFDHVFLHFTIGIQTQSALQLGIRQNRLDPRCYICEFLVTSTMSESFVLVE